MFISFNFQEYICLEYNFLEYTLVQEAIYDIRVIRKENDTLIIYTFFKEKYTLNTYRFIYIWYKNTERKKKIYALIIYINVA